MNQNKAFSRSFLVITLVAFLFGTAFGLFVLGWWLWPVNWVDGSIESLNPSAQKDYLQAAVDAYSYNHDTQIAQQRYNALGTHKDQILLDVYQSPEPLTTTEIEDFAAAIGAQDVLAGETLIPIITPTASRAFDFGAINPVWVIVFLIALGVGVILFTIFLLILRNRKKQKKSEEGEVSIKTFDTPEEFSSGEEQSASLAKTQPTTKSMDYQTSDDIEEGELPDWLLQTGSEGFVSNEEIKESEPIVELSDQDYEELTSSGFPFMPEKPPDFERETTQAAGSQPDETSTSKSESGLLKMSHKIVTSADSQSPEIGKETTQETYRKFSHDIESLPGISEEEAQKFREVGINAPLLLLKNAASTHGRQSLSDQSLVEPSRILELVNFIDLYRIKGLTIDDAVYLKAAGITRMIDLAVQDPVIVLKNLEDAVIKSGEPLNPPTLEQVKSWIEQANHLPRVVVE
jgi:hypothetical protein